MGWERKRGKLEEFNQLLRGATDTSFTVQVGDLAVLAQWCATCITLDADTRLPRDAAQQPDRHRRAPAQPAVVRSKRRPGDRGLRHPAAAACSVTHGERRAARCFARVYAPATPASIPIPRPCPTSIRTCSAKASSPARASTTSTPSPPALGGRVPGEHAAVARPLRRALRARARWCPTSRWWTTTRSNVLAHAPPAAPLGARRLADPAGGCSRSCRTARGIARNRLPLIAAGRSWTTCAAACVPPAPAGPAAGGVDAPARRSRWCWTAVGLAGVAAFRCLRRPAPRQAPANAPPRSQSARPSWTTSAPTASALQILLLLALPRAHDASTPSAITLVPRLVVTQPADARMGNRGLRSRRARPASCAGRRALVLRR